MTHQQTVGTRAQVWHGTAKHTSGNLTKSQLMMNKHGRIVSRRKHNTAKRENRLVKAGFLTKKGHFGFIQKDGKSSHHRNKKSKMIGHKSRRHKSKMRGGGSMSALNPSTYVDK